MVRIYCDAAREIDKATPAAREQSRNAVAESGAGSRRVLSGERVDDDGVLGAGVYR